MRLTTWLAAIIAAVMLIPFGTVNAADHGEQKAVLITGASSGIGRHATEQLAAAGYFVYAGARKQEDIDALNEIDNVMAVRLDVTVQDEIDAAVALVESEGRGLWGLVNNAGINVLGPLVEGDEDDLKFLFDVNVYGVYRVTQAFAPMIIESKGRIVNISSIAGILSGGLPGYGPYMMSKHAVEAYSDQLTFELAPLGVKVSAVEPGNFSTQIGQTRCERMMADIESKDYKYFAEAMQQYVDWCKQRLSEDYESSAPPPALVSDAIQHALFDDTPKEHYLVVANPFEAMITIVKSFEELLHLNHDHPYSYSRDELIAMLDEEWAILRGEKERNWGPPQ